MLEQPLDNAAKYSPRRGPIEVTRRRGGRRVVASSRSPIAARASRRRSATACSSRSRGSSATPRCPGRGSGSQWSRSVAERTDGRVEIAERDGGGTRDPDRAAARGAQRLAAAASGAAPARTRRAVRHSSGNSMPAARAASGSSDVERHARNRVDLEQPDARRPGVTIVSARDIPRQPSALCAAIDSRWHSSRALSLTRAGMMWLLMPGTYLRLVVVELVLGNDLERRQRQRLVVADHADRDLGARHEPLDEHALVVPEGLLDRRGQLVGRVRRSSCRSPSPRSRA